MINQNLLKSKIALSGLSSKEVAEKMGKLNLIQVKWKPWKMF